MVDNQYEEVFRTNLLQTGYDSKEKFYNAKDIAEAIIPTLEEMIKRQGAILAREAATYLSSHLIGPEYQTSSELIGIVIATQGRIKSATLVDILAQIYKTDKKTIILKNRKGATSFTGWHKTSSRVFYKSEKELIAFVKSSIDSLETQTIVNWKN